MPTAKRWLLEAKALVRTFLLLDPLPTFLDLHTAEKYIQNNETPFAFLKRLIEKEGHPIPLPPERIEPASNKELLDALENWTKTHVPPECKSLESAAKGLVFGEGNPNAKILFIGEAPGEQEDIQGRPFVGRSGKLLDKLLEAIGLERPDVYITNIVKFRPPGNRDPEPEEKEASLPTLLEQLDIIEPKVIATLGRHSTTALLPKVKVHMVRGKTQRDEAGRIILPIYHPAAALYDPNKLTDLETQFLTLQALSAGLIKTPAYQDTLL